MNNIIYLKDINKKQKDNLVKFPNSKKSDDIPVIFNENKIAADEYHKRDYKKFWKYVTCFILGMFFMFLLK